MLQKNYNLYYFSRIICDIGDALQDIAVIAIISMYSNSTFLSGLIITMNALIKILCSFSAINISVELDSKKMLSSLNYLYAGITFFFFLFFKTKMDNLFIVVIIYESLCSLIYTFYKIYQDTLVKELATTNQKIARLYTTDNIVKIVSSLVSSVLLLVLSIDWFLIINAMSFLISGIFIKNIQTAVSTNQSKIKQRKSFNIVKNIQLFYNGYPMTFKIIILSAVLSFIYATYSVLLQKVITIFSIDVKYIGIITAAFYLLSILFSYLAGFVKCEQVEKVIYVILGIGVVASLICCLNNKILILIYIVFLFPLFGSGYNTFIQIFFQNETAKDDIPLLKGIYNIFCGISILLSGLITPLLLKSHTLIIFFGIIIFLLIVCILYVITSINKK